MNSFFEPKFASIAVFIVAYLFFIVFSRTRALVAVIGAALLIVTGTISPIRAFWVINWNVMGIFVGMLAVADIFMRSRVPAFLAQTIVNHSTNTCWAILLICLMTGFISAFVENVATVLIVAPIALSLARKLNINPTKMMFSIAISSNLQGAATLIGDPPSMLLGGFAKMDFGNFFFYYGKPSIFFAVELGALFSFFVLYLVFRKLKEKNNLVETEKITSLMPTYILLALIILLTISSFLNSSSNCAAGTLCMIFGFIALLWEKVKNRGDIFQIIKFLDWETTFFLIGVFVLVGGITITGWIENVSDFLAVLVGNNVFWGYTMLVFTAVILSAFIDNVPFLAAMLPVAITMSEKLGINQSLLMFGLLIGASLGGNITPIGASANIVACGLLKKEGYPVKFGEFVNLGLPFTLIAVFVAYVFVWVIWS